MTVTSKTGMDHGFHPQWQLCHLQLAVQHDLEGAIVLQEVKCSSRVMISILKEDIASLTGMGPSEQHWSLRGSELKDGDTLTMHGIHLMDQPQILIQKNH